MIKELSDVSLMTAEGRLLMAAIDTIVEIRNISDGHAPETRQRVFDDLLEDDSVKRIESILGPVNGVTDPHVADIELNEAQATILFQMAQIRKIGESNRMGRKVLQFDTARRGKFQAFDIPFETGRVKLHQVIFLICRVWEGWGKHARPEIDIQDESFAREIAFRARFWNSPMSGIEHHWLQEGMTDEFWSKLNQFMGRRETIETTKP